MLYTLCEHELTYLGLDDASIDDIIRDEYKLQIVASSIINHLIKHMLPSMISLQMPLNVKAHRTADTEFELFMQFMHPLEVLDYELGYDEFIDLSKKNNDYGFLHENKNGINDITDYYEDVEDEDNIDEEEIIIWSFKHLDDVIRYVKYIDFINDKPTTALYKFKNEYHLVCDFIKVIDVHDVIRCEHMATEHNCIACYDALFKSLLEEHGKCIIESNAIDVLLTI